MLKFLKKHTGWFWENFKILIYALILTFLLKTFFFQPFHIPSGSMKPGLLPGDYIFVNKFAYGFSKYSLSFYPSFLLSPTNKNSKYLALFPSFLSSNKRIFETLPKRGDVIIFVPPKKPEIFYVKRLIGMPHDIIEIKDRKIFINGKALEEKFISKGGDKISFDDEDDYDIEIDHKNKSSKKIQKQKELVFETDVFNETNGEKTYNTMYSDERPTMNDAKFFVPEGHFFVMGDNRDNSLDGRYLDEVGYIPFQNVIGRASFVFFSFNKENLWPISKMKSFFRSDRFFKRIK